MNQEPIRATVRRVLTIDDLERALAIAKRRSTLGGQTVVVLSEMEVEYRSFVDVGVDGDGSVCLLSLHRLSGPDMGLNEDGLPPTCVDLDEIDSMSPDERMDECFRLGAESSGGWPDKKCIEFLREKMNLPTPNYQDQYRSCNGS